MSVRANRVDQDQTKKQPDQSQHFLPFHLHLLGALLHCEKKKTVPFSGQLGVLIFFFFFFFFLQNMLS